MNIIRKHAKNFTKYSIIGVIWTLLNVTFMWMFIDALKFTALIGSTIVVVVLIIMKYFAYVLWHMIHGKFFKYLSTVIVFNIANVALMWLAVDIMSFPTIISSVIIVSSLFLLKFVTFNLVGLVKHHNE